MDIDSAKSGQWGDQEWRDGDSYLPWALYPCLAHELLEQGWSAHLVIQHANLVKLNQYLNAKENKKEEDCTTLFTGGLGRHLTDSEVTDQLMAQNQRKEAKAAERAKRKSGHEVDTVVQAAVEAE